MDPNFISQFFELLQYLLDLKLIREGFTYIKIDEITKVGILGAGSFGSVSLCDIHGEKCAVKELCGHSKDSDSIVKALDI